MNIQPVPSNKTLSETQEILDGVVDAAVPGSIILSGEYAWSGALTLNDADDIGILGVNAYITQQDESVSTILITDCTNILVSDINVIGGAHAVSCFGGSGDIRYVTLTSGSGDAVVEDSGWSVWSQKIDELIGSPGDIGAEETSNKGVPNGYAALDSSGNIDASQLSMSIELWDSEL